MKQNVLFAMVLSTLICSVSIGAELQEPSVENSPLDKTSKASVEETSKRSHKKRPDPLVFPEDFSSDKASEGTALDNTAAKTSHEAHEKVSTPINFPKVGALSRIKYTATQLAIQGKELALRVFTKENAHLAHVYIKTGVDHATTFTVMIAVFSIESIKWFFDMLNSLRVTLLTPKPKQKID